MDALRRRTIIKQMAALDMLPSRTPEQERDYPRYSPSSELPGDPDCWRDVRRPPEDTRRGRR